MCCTADALQQVTIPDDTLEIGWTAARVAGSPPVRVTYREPYQDPAATPDPIQTLTT